MQSETTNELSAALAKAQRDMKAAAFNRINPHFKNRYADLTAVLDAIREPLATNGCPSRRPWKSVKTVSSW